MQERSNILERVKFRTELLGEVDSKIILDSRVAQLLKLIDEKGSILSASRSLGIPYSRAWEAISRIERVLGIKVIETIRGGVGGGGTRLTEHGRLLVREYFRRYREVGSRIEKIGEVKVALELHIAGSHDPLLENSLKVFKTSSGMHVEYSTIGSAGGLASLMMGDADIACTHLYDPETGKYNIPFLGKYWLADKSIVVRGYDREIVLAFHPKVQLNGFHDIIEGKVRIVNRVLGSGTRVLFDYLLEKTAKKLGVNSKEIPLRVKGYSCEVKTHYDVARAIVEGKADVGLTLRIVAEQYGLKWFHILWEHFDFVVRSDRSEKKGVKKFLEFISGPKFRKIIEKTSGYRVDENQGKVIYP